MLPNLALLNQQRKGSINTVIPCNMAAWSRVVADGFHLILGKFCHSMANANLVCAVTLFVGKISSSRIPPKVVKAVILRVSIAMTRLEKRWSFTNKSLQHQPMSGRTKVFTKSVLMVPKRVQSGLKNPTFEFRLPAKAVCYDPIYRTSPAKVGYFVTRVFGYRLPDFFHRIISLKMIPYEAHGRQVREPAFRSVELSAQVGL